MTQHDITGRFSTTVLVINKNSCPKGFFSVHLSARQKFRKKIFRNYGNNELFCEQNIYACQQRWHIFETSTPTKVARTEKTQRFTTTASCSNLEKSEFLKEKWALRMTRVSSFTLRLVYRRAV
jgi:hypothetical protein